jgi:hypothetical protein
MPDRLSTRHDGGPLAAIRREFPGWRPFRSDAGRWWASRVGVRRPRNPPHWWAMTVDGDTAEDLREALAKQAAGHPG